MTAIAFGDQSAKGTSIMNLSGICAQTVVDALDRAAAIGPDIEAVVAPDGRITFAELQTEVARLCSALSAMGVERGDHVGLCLGNSVRWLSLFYAIGSLGAVTVPVNTRLRNDEIAYVLGQAKLKYLFLADRLLNVDFIAMFRDICPAIGGKLPDAAFPNLKRIVIVGDEVPAGATSWNDFYEDGQGDAAPGCKADDILLIQYTSGTTSFPKGVMLTHSNMLTNSFFVSQRIGLRPADRYHSARPFFHVAGTTLSILAALHATATLVTMTRFEAKEALTLLETERCTHVSGNDTMILMLLNHPDLDRSKLSLRGGWAAATPSVMKRMIDELGAREAVTTYGMSETSPNISISCWWEPEAVRADSRMRLQPGIEVKLRNPDTHEPIAPGEPGELLVRGWNVMRGYFEKPEETAAALDADGWLATGDVVDLDKNRRLKFVARAKDILRVGGENVSPAEVEDMLHRHPKIRHAQIVGVPDERLVEVPAAFVVLKEGEDADPDDLLTWAKERLAGFKAPRYLRIVDGFETIGMTASSKVKRKELTAYAIKVLGLDGRDAAK